MVGKDNVTENKKVPLKRDSISHGYAGRFQLQPTLIKYLNKRKYRRPGNIFVVIFIIQAFFFAVSAN